MSGISPSKKRKAHDGRAAASDDTSHDVQINGGGCDKKSPSTQSCGGNLSQQMDTVMQIMLRMEEKCNRLEAKCNSLENILKEHVDSKIDSLDAKMDKKFKQHGYHSLLAMNHSWKYSAPVYSEQEWMEQLDECYEYAEAEYLSETSEKLRELTEKMRRGEFPSSHVEVKTMGIDVEVVDNGEGRIFDHYVNNYLLPHWREFAAALKQFTPAFNVLPDDCETFLYFYNVQLNHDAMLLIKDALMSQPFQKLTFMNDINRAGNGDRRGMSINAIVDIVNSNKHLRMLDLENNVIYHYNIEGICSSVHNHPSLVHLDLRNCFNDGDGLGDEMLTSLLRNGTLKLEKLVMSANNITSNVTTLLSNFLATDPLLKELDLSDNRLLTNDDAVLIANALRSNTSLRRLDLEGSSITNVGAESFRLVLNNDSTLNSVSDSNHSCYLCVDECYPWMMNQVYERRNDLGEEREKNRGRKIYKLLSSRHKSMSNVQHFGNIDVKILPNIVGAVQIYASCQVETDVDFVRELSIVYEMMRKWDKVFSLFM